MSKILCLCLWIFVVLISFVKRGVMGFDTQFPCPQPRGGYCVDIRECPDMYQLVRRSPPPLTKEVAQILLKHQCGVKGKYPLVCCSDKTNRIHKRPFPQSEASLPPQVVNNRNLYMLPTEDCGKMALKNVRITGGSKAELNEFPWMALLFTKENNSSFNIKCAGTIINRFYVLTAAHCVYNQEGFGVRLGEYNVDTDRDCSKIDGYCAPSVQVIYPEKVIVHPNYSVTEHTNDIALIRLKKPASFDYENVQPICLPVGEPAKSNLIGRYLTVCGWGTSNNGFLSSIPLQTKVPVVPLELCKKIYRNIAEITYTQICAGGEKGQDSCKGDSGGPLKYAVEYDDNISRYVQYGIVSYGPRECGLDGYPAIYTNVAYYMNWILEVIKH